VYPKTRRIYLDVFGEDAMKHGILFKQHTFRPSSRSRASASANDRCTTANDRRANVL
jgi:hypothetical protein